MTNASPTSTALSGLIILQIVMLAALFSRTAPHPPLSTPLFGLGPFLGASIAAAAAAIMVGEEQTRAGKALSAIAVLMALISFGPQKYVDAQFPLIWPAVIAAQICVVTIAVRLGQLMKARG